MNWRRPTVALVLIVIALAYFSAGGEDLFDPREFQRIYDESPLMTAGIFFLVYLLGTAFSLPVMGVLSVIAGMIFGHVVGISISLLACTVGGTAAFLVSRYVLHDQVQRRFAEQLVNINKGIEKEGVFYLFSLRMVPLIPFWTLTLVAGLTPINVRRFVLATLFGTLPLIAVLVHFGTQIGAMETFSIRTMFSPNLLLALALVGALPFITKGIVRLLRRPKRKGV